jgi:hypothetical protein
MATVGRIRSFAPTAAKLADSKGAYLAAIQTRRQEEAAARKEREVCRRAVCVPRAAHVGGARHQPTLAVTCVQGRRRRMLVEQQAARVAAEGRMEANCVLEVLVKQSGEEQKLGERLWQLQQEKVHACHCKGRVSLGGPWAMLFLTEAGMTADRVALRTAGVHGGQQAAA